MTSFDVYIRFFRNEKWSSIIIILPRYVDGLNEGKEKSDHFTEYGTSFFFLVGGLP